MPARNPSSHPGHNRERGSLQWPTQTMVPETRNPRPEIRTKAEVRGPKVFGNSDFELRPSDFASIDHQRAHRVAGQLLAPAEEAQLDEEGNFKNLPAQPLDQRRCRGRGAAGSEQVIDEQHAAPWLERIDVYRNGRSAIFQFVILLVRLVGELSFFAHRELALQVDLRAIAERGV